MSPLRVGSAGLLGSEEVVGGPEILEADLLSVKGGEGGAGGALPNPNEPNPALGVAGSTRLVFDGVLAKEGRRECVGRVVAFEASEATLLAAETVRPH